MKFTLNESAEGNAAGVPLAAPGSEESAVRANGKKPSSSKRFWENPPCAKNSSVICLRCP